MSKKASSDNKGIHKHETRLESLALETLSRVLGKEELMPATLFHYTDATGLVGILKEGQIRATHQEFMTDPSETEHAKAIALQLLNDKLSRDEDTRATLAKGVGEGPLTWDGEYHVDAYVASFSKSRDSLSQWRAYANDGRGFSIGIDPRSTPYGQRLESFEAGTAFFRVTYVEQDTRDRLWGFLDRGLGLVAEAVESGTSRQLALNRLRVWFQLVVQLSKRVCKQFGYREECEWRLVSIRRRTTPPYNSPEVAGVEFRSGRGQVIPYITLPLSRNGPKSYVRSIWLGPAAAEPERELALKMLLRGNGYPASIEVCRSQTQYRP